MRRYGFHGLSYEYIASELPKVVPAIAGGRVVLAHLGNGASLCAMQGGRSVDTTMGLTPLDGLPMDTRCGAPDGRVMEVFSEHLYQGWLEGYLLTGRHGFFSCYEAFIHIVDSMFNQHAKWLKTIRHVRWRRPIASLNYLLTSHVWRQDHNGSSHQDPGFIDHVVNKSPTSSASICRPTPTHCCR